MCHDDRNTSWLRNGNVYDYFPFFVLRKKCYLSCVGFLIYCFDLILRIMLEINFESC